MSQVQYNINGWLDKNKDPIQECVIQLMQESKEPLVATFFREPEEGVSPVNFHFERKDESIQHLYSATSHIPQLQRRCCVAYRAGVQPIGRLQSLLPRTLTFDQTVIRSPDLPFNGLHPRNLCNYMDYYLFTDPGGM